MGGFIKGIVTGVASFVLGFAVLSVVMPVEDPPAEDGALRGDDVAIVAQPETLTTLPDPVQADASG